MVRAIWNRAGFAASGCFAGVLVVPAFLMTLTAATAQAPAAAPNPQIVAAQASFESLPEAERKAIQSDLIWTGHFNGAISGSYGPLTFRAINALKAGSQGAPDGMLNPAERRALAQAAQVARDAAGFRLVTDERTGVRIGIPTKLLPRRDATPTGGSRWQSEDGKITLDTSTTPETETLVPLFERATATNVPGRKITYKLIRPDFFVVTGETATGRFYRRLAAGPGALRGFSIGYDKAMAGTVDKLVIAIAGSFEPFPIGPAAAAATAVASAAAVATPPAVALPVRVTERYGVAVALSDKVVVTAAPALEGCRALRVGGRNAKLRMKDEASGLVLLDLEGSGGGAAPVLRKEALSERESVVLVAFSDESGKRAAVALPGQGARIAAGSAVFAPLQPGQSGSPVFDRQGRLTGLVTGNPSDKVLIAGVAPQRSYGVADVGALQGVLAKAGMSLAAAPSGADLSTGAVVDKVGKTVLPIVCGL
jgi:hypothetical protein